VGVLSPITTEPNLRSFGVIDLEWVPARRLPLPASTLVDVEGMRTRCRIPLPPKERVTEPLQVRMAAVYDVCRRRGGGERLDEPEVEERYAWFPTVSELIDAILVRENRGRWFYAHAGGLSDMAFVLDVIVSEVRDGLVRTTRSRSVPATGAERELGIDGHEERRAGAWTVRASFSGSSAIIVHVSRGKNAWHFLDSYWLLRDKLSKIGEAIGLKKGGSPSTVAYMMSRFGKVDLDELTPLETEAFYADAPIEVLVDYNRRDCEILHKGISEFETEILELGGQLQQTIASTGMSLFRRAYLKRTILTSERLNQVADETYYASRVEVLERSGEDLLMYDINSSFPHAMTFPQPGGCIAVRADLPDSWLVAGSYQPDDPAEQNIFIADVTIEVPETELPSVPYRVEGRVFFPTGRWRSWLTSVDIRLALAEGCTLHKVHEVYSFEPFMDLAAYATNIYGRRAAATTSFRKLVLKYLLNCLYGKFAEGLDKQEMLVNPPADEIDRAGMQLLMPGVWLHGKESPVAHRHVPISTHITSIARRTLYMYLKECYRQGRPPFYCDTDSCATKADLPCDDKRLGALKLEKSLTWAEFWAPKIYRAEGYELVKESGQWVRGKEVRTTKAKGFSLGKSKEEAWSRFEAIVGGEQVGIQRMARIRELYRGTDTAPVDMLVIKALTFEALSKRFHYPDGKTRPWQVRELVSGDFYPQGFDFEPDVRQSLAPTTLAMMRAVV